MRAPARKMMYLTLPLLALLTVASHPPASAAIISLQPSALTPVTGSSFSVSVDITSATDLYAFQFDVTFDPQVLSAVGVTEGPFLPLAGPTLFVPGNIDNVAGSITFTADALIGAGPGVSGSGSLAVIGFQALAAGNTAIDLLGITLLNSDLIADTSFSVTGNVVEVVSASQVPEPSTLILIGIGIISLAKTCRRAAGRC